MKAAKTTLPRYETRYKHKLNMLWPGGAMMKAVAALLVLGGILSLIGWDNPAYYAFGLAGAVFGVLLILVAVELHQDRVLNEIAMKENREEKII